MTDVSQATTTREVSGHPFTLVPGRSYIATRAAWRVEVYDVTEEQFGPRVFRSEPVGVRAADAIVAEFNDGSSPWATRKLEFEGDILLAPARAWA